MSSDKKPTRNDQGLQAPPPPRRNISVPPKMVFTPDDNKKKQGAKADGNKRTAWAGAVNAAPKKPPPPAPRNEACEERPASPGNQKPPSTSAGRNAAPKAPPPPPKRDIQKTTSGPIAAPPAGTESAAEDEQKRRLHENKPGKDDYFDDGDYVLEKEWKGILLRKKRPMNNGCLRGAMYFALITIVSVVLAINIWSWVNDILALTKEEGSLTINIPEDYSYKSLADQLAEEGVIEHAWLFAVYCDLSEASKYIDPGVRTIYTDHDYRALVHDMRYVPERVQVAITFPEGVTFARILDILEENGVSNREDLLDAAKNGEYNYGFLEGLPATENRLEGYLYPDTYFFFTDTGPRSVFMKFLGSYNQNITKTMRKRIDEMPYSMHEIITIASLIQAEAASIGEMKNIASVIYNRLNSNQFPHLEIDASLIYVMDGRREITAADLQMDNPYNLYVAEGLPPGPICSPSIHAIRAAIYPAENTGLYYYALTDSGVHQFSKTYNEHLQVRKNNPKTYPNG